MVNTRYYSSQLPYNQLESHRIINDNPARPEWVTGTHPSDADCLNPSSYDLIRQCDATELGTNGNFYYGDFERTSRGYQGIGKPHQYHGVSWEDFVTNANEDFADMFMNWVYDSFDDSPLAYGAGRYRYEFMEDNMRSWITGGSITTRQSVQ